MRRSLAIIALFAFIAMGMAGFGVAHHGDFNSVNCALTCIREMQPIATVALIAVIVLLFAIFESTAVIFDTGFSQSFDTRPRTRFRTQIDRWFSLLEHSPTA